MKIHAMVINDLMCSLDESDDEMADDNVCRDFGQLDYGMRVLIYIMVYFFWICLVHLSCGWIYLFMRANLI
jgi:hypothetical protein